MNTFERLGRHDFEIHEVDHQERITVDGALPVTERIISRKYVTLIPNLRFEPG
jgi:hypothetical protein